MNAVIGSGASTNMSYVSEVHNAPLWKEIYVKNVRFNRKDDISIPNYKSFSCFLLLFVYFSLLLHHRFQLVYFKQYV